MVCLVGCTSVVLASFPWNGEGATLCPYALIDLAVTHHYIPSRELTSAHPLALLSFLGTVSVTPLHVLQWLIQQTGRIPGTCVMPSAGAILQLVAPVSPRSSRRRLLRPSENHRPTAPPGANRRRVRTMTSIKDSFDAAVDAKSTCFSCFFAHW
jgi:hypothetical protein